MFSGGRILKMYFASIPSFYWQEFQPSYTGEQWVYSSSVNMISGWILKRVLTWFHEYREISWRWVVRAWVQCGFDNEYYFHVHVIYRNWGEPEWAPHDRYPRQNHPYPRMYVGLYVYVCGVMSFTCSSRKCISKFGNLMLTLNIAHQSSQHWPRRDVKWANRDGKETRRSRICSVRIPKAVEWSRNSGINKMTSDTTLVNRIVDTVVISLAAKPRNKRLSNTIACANYT